MKLALLSLYIMLVGGCNNSSEGGELAQEVSSMPESTSEKPPSDSKAFVVSPEAKVIREGQLRFETSDLESSYSQVKNAVAKHGGTIEHDAQGKDYGSIFRNITVRVPSIKFDAFITDVGAGVTYFDRKEFSARDVTEEYIDIDARLHAKKTLESRYLELLKQAKSVAEILEIEKQLSLIREEIESKQGQMKYLQSRIAMSTITIEIYKRTATEAGITTSYGSKMWNAVVSGFNAFSGFLIGLLFIWPFILILGVILYILRKKFRKSKLL